METAPIGRLIAPRFAGSATIFVLHHVVRGENNALDRGLAVTEKFLDAAIAHVIGRGYRIASLSELSQWMGTGQMTPPVVVFTFDDGYVSNAAMAAPIFEKYKVPWCLYLTTGFPDRTCSYWWRALELLLLERDVVEFDLPPLRRRYHVRSMSAKRAAFSEISRIVQEHAIDISQYLRCRYGSDARSLLDAEALSWRDVRDLMSNRFFELGAHTVSHPVLANLDEQSARREMVDCRRRIREVTGVEVSHFAYPFGSPDAAGEREYAIAQDVGYRTATTTVQRGIHADANERMHALPRLWLDGRNERLAQLDAHLTGLTALMSLRGRHPLLRRS